MGVTGLWRLIEPAGKPVPVETLENKVLAVDISIWLHQMVKGYQDAKGAPLPNAHLIGLFQRLCKLLYFRVKPVFVFDGGFPELKKETIAKRQDSKSKYNSESERLKRELAILLSKKTAISSLLGKQISPKKNNIAIDNNDIFKLPALPQREESDSESDEDEESSSSSIIDLHSVDLESENFKKLPVKEKYDLLVELKETRKMNSWGRLHELPKKSDNFSDFQMQRLLKRRKVQECIEETEKEMGDSGMSLNELESLLNEEGIDTKINTLPTRRIASNNTTRFLLINDVKQALADAKKRKEIEEITEKLEIPKQDLHQSNKDDLEKAIKMSLECVGVSNKEIEEIKEQPSTSKISEPELQIKQNKRDELEEDLEKAIKMSLECVNEPETSISKTDDSWTSIDITDSDYHNTDSEEEDGYEEIEMSSAKAYITQYTDFTHKAIDALVTTKRNSNKTINKVPKVKDIIKELNKEKCVILDKFELSSSDEGYCIKINKIKRSSTSKDAQSSDNISTNATQGSVIYVESTSDEVVSLDTSTEHSIEGDEKISDSIAKKPNTVATRELCTGAKNLNSLNTTQESVVYVKTTRDEIVSIDTSTENNIKDNEKKIDRIPEISDTVATRESGTGAKNVVDEVVSFDINKDNKHTNDLISPEINVSKDEESSASDDDFEEVPENQNKPVVQLTLDMGKEIDDDIFADVFGEKQGFQKISNDTIHAIAILKSVPEEKESNEKEDVVKELCKESDIEIPIMDNISPSVSSSSEILAKSITLHKEIIKTKEHPKETVFVEKLASMAEEIQHEEQNLIQEKGKLDRIGRNITEQMTKEAQELLQIFGIPYIVAPMEAEAQCAFLESVKLTDGTITDDSDIWLFGGKTVYKNFFNQKKHVLQFLSERIERSFNLTREQLILLALLVGSDYTTGLTGVGPVTALEILASFPFNKKKFLTDTSKQSRYAQIISGLQEFKQWVRAGKRTDNITLKKKLRNVQVTDDFPSIRVVQAYLEPNIEKSEEKFTWGELDITVLRDYTKAKFGWSQHKLDEIIKPVMKRLQDRNKQKTVYDYFKRTVEFQSLEDKMSKRVKAAVQRMDSENPHSNTEISEKNKKTKITRKRKSKESESKLEKSGPSKAKNTKNTEESVLLSHNVKVVSQAQDDKSNIDIEITKTDKYQEIIPQREKDKRSLLENKLKAIELFRKTKIDKRRKVVKRKVNLPKEKAELSESSDSN